MYDEERPPAAMLHCGLSSIEGLGVTLAVAGEPFGLVVYELPRVRSIEAADPH
jgi:hypothetical protein